MHAMLSGTHYYCVFHLLFFLLYAVPTAAAGSSIDCCGDHRYLYQYLLLIIKSERGNLEFGSRYERYVSAID